MNKMLSLIPAAIFCLSLLFASALSAAKVSTHSNSEGQATDVADAKADGSTNATLFDIKAGQKLYKKTCKNCHGPTAKGMASFPKLVDKDAAYLIERLKQYRAGEQVGPNTPLMAPQAVKLSDEDISNISYYIVSLNQ